MTNHDSPSNELQERIELAKRGWWNFPLIVCLLILPESLALWGYFDAAGWVDRIPALEHLGAPIFIAIAVGLTTKVILRTALMVATYVTQKQVTSRTRVFQFILFSTYQAFLIILQNIALVKFTPTIFYTFQAARCALSLLLKKPSWSFASEVSEKWDLADRKRHTRYMLSMFSSFALINAFVGFYFSTDVWMIYNFVAFYCMMGVSSFSVYLFRNEIFGSSTA